MGKHLAAGPCSGLCAIPSSRLNVNSYQFAAHVEYRMSSLVGVCNAISLCVKNVKCVVFAN